MKEYNQPGRWCDQPVERSNNAAFTGTTFSVSIA
jgi:hypothetical protein